MNQEQLAALLVDMVRSAVARNGVEALGELFEGYDGGFILQVVETCFPGGTNPQEWVRENWNLQD